MQNLNELLEYIEELLNNALPHKALNLCNRLLEDHPQNIDIIFLKAIALQMDGQLSRALKALQKAALYSKE